MLHPDNTAILRYREASEEVSAALKRFLDSIEPVVAAFQKCNTQKTARTAPRNEFISELVAQGKKPREIDIELKKHSEYPRIGLEALRTLICKLKREGTDLRNEFISLLVAEGKKSSEIHAILQTHPEYPEIGLDSLRTLIFKIRKSMRSRHTAHNR